MVEKWLTPLRTVGQPQVVVEGWGCAIDLAGSRESNEAKSLPGPHPVPCPGSGQGLEPGAAALMRRCCCSDSALQRCLHLFYFSIIKTQAATQPDSLAVGVGNIISAEKAWLMLAPGPLLESSWVPLVGLYQETRP